jgi:hypothetical protein
MKKDPRDAVVSWATWRCICFFLFSFSFSFLLTMFLGTLNYITTLHLLSLANDERQLAGNNHSWRQQMTMVDNPHNPETWCPQEGECLSNLSTCSGDNLHANLESSQRNRRRRNLKAREEPTNITDGASINPLWVERWSYFIHPLCVFYAMTSLADFGLFCL